LASLFEAKQKYVNYEEVQWYSLYAC